MVVARLPGRHARHQVARRLEVEQRDLRHQQIRLHPLSSSGFLALEQRRHDPERGEKARRDVRDRGARAHRSLAGQPRDRHEPAHTLRDLIEARPVAVRSILAEARNAREDDARVDLRERLVVDAQPEFHVGAVVLDDDIGGLHELHEDRDAPLVLQVEGDRALVAVQVLEVRTVARAAHRLALDARRRFDLDDVRPEIGELAHAGGPCAHARKIEDAKARKRGGGGNVGHG